MRTADAIGTVPPSGPSLIPINAIYQRKLDAMARGDVMACKTGEKRLPILKPAVQAGAAMSKIFTT
jgi:hypothetical protein